MTGLGKDAHTASGEDAMDKMISYATSAVLANMVEPEAPETIACGVLYSLGIPLEVLAAIKAGTWVPLPAELTPEQDRRAHIAIRDASTSGQATENGWAEIKAAAPKTPSEV